MYQAIIIIHVLAGLGVIGLVLMQQGRGADAGAAFGSGSSGSVFGAQGSASFLSRATSIFAVIFFSTSLGLAVLGGQLTGNKDLMDAPDVEQAIPDLPVIFDDEPMRVPSISDQQEDLPITFDDTESSDNKLLDQTNTEESAEQVFDFESIVPDNLESEK